MSALYKYCFWGLKGAKIGEKGADLFFLVLG